MKARTVILISLLTFSTGLFLGTKMITPTELSLEEEILAQELRLKGVERILNYMQQRLMKLRKEQIELEPQVGKLTEEKVALENQAAALAKEKESLQARLEQLNPETDESDAEAKGTADSEADLTARVKALESGLDQLRAQVAALLPKAAAPATKGSVEPK